jgi:hypothetical protein
MSKWRANQDISAVFSHASLSKCRTHVSHLLILPSNEVDSRLARLLFCPEISGYSHRLFSRVPKTRAG